MHRAAIIRGDGIGPEISEATLKIIEASGARVRWEEVLIGQEAKRRLGAELPWGSLEQIRRIGVALKAPLIAERCGDGVRIEADGEVRQYPSINNGLRRELDAYANLRPARGWPGVSGPYLNLDLVIVREVTEDLYIGIERRVDDDSAEAIKRISGTASRRVARFACDYAIRNGRKKITAVHKANVLHLTDGLFLQSVRSVVGDYPALTFDDQMVDATCYRLIKHPEIFDVLVLPNQYGDILSDVVAGLVGSLGLAPGANIGPEVAVFEAAHGAAPDIAGRGIANPIGLALSGAMLLDHLGETEAAKRIRHGVTATLADERRRTPDLGGQASTAELTEAICERIRND
ncbi:MAG: isocitrate/isopropylmalate dehydrogenase family protein [Blastocatellia bacterium]